MLTVHAPAAKQQILISIFVFLGGMLAAWQLGGQIAVGDMRTVELVGLLCIACAAAVAILKNWRTGFYMFLMWLLFEDLPRKYMGNGMALFFGKDILALFTYVSLLNSIRQGRDKTFRPPFLLPLAVFVWLGAIQIFNQNSPHILYGLLGFKIYFFYLPLIWVGYALIRNDDDLRKFLIANALFAAVIGGIGIIQGIVGNSFLNPTTLAPELRELGNLDRISPLTGQVFNLPVGVFVSTGRYGNYLALSFPILVGAAGYFLLYKKRGRKLVFISIGILGAAALLSGSRTCVAYVVGSALILVVGFLWGAPWRWHQGYRMVKAIRRSFIVGALGLAAILFIFPQQAGSRLAFYTETMLPSSSAYEVGSRGWNYPLYNLQLALTAPNWILGNGIGIASLGRQYVSMILKRPDPGIWVEEGFGVLIVELGILAPFLWIVWASVLSYHCWKVVRRLRETRLFPIGFAMFLYIVLLLFPFTWAGLSVYQNYINNAYLWLLTGIIFRLPDVLASARATVPAPPVGPQPALPR